MQRSKWLSRSFSNAKSTFLDDKMIICSLIIPKSLEYFKFNGKFDKIYKIYAFENNPIWFNEEKRIPFYQRNISINWHEWILPTSEISSVNFFDTLYLMLYSPTQMKIIMFVLIWKIIEKIIRAEVCNPSFIYVCTFFLAQSFLPLMKLLSLKYTRL